jgi:glycosyltransferase involved in cell wall biosynthesis
MLSELHPVKRIEDALEAFALLRESCPETRLVVLGEGQERERLEALIRTLHLGGYAHLAGQVPGGDAYLKAFDIFLQASRSEALGLAVIEAGLAGLPVVATAVGGIPEIIDDGVTGLLVEPYQPEAMAEALAELVQDSARATALGRALNESVVRRFEPAQMMRETLALYLPT